MAKKKFVDSDLGKTPGEGLNSIFGDMLTPLNGATSDNSTVPPAPVQATPAPAEGGIPSEPVPAPEAIPEATPEATPEAIPEPAPAPEQVPAGGDTPPEGDQTKDPEKLLEEILFGTDNVADAAEKLKAATAKGEDVSAETTKLLAEIDSFNAKEAAYKAAMAKAMSQIEEYETEKALTEVEIAKKSKMYEIIMGDDGLKTLVALKKRADENPEYKKEYQEFLTEFYETNTGNNISHLVANAKKSEKEAIGGGDFSTPGSASVDDVFGGILTKI